MTLNQDIDPVLDHDGREGLDRLLSPRTIAVIGASDRPGRIGTVVFENVARLFAGDVYPVNPRGGSFGGVEAVREISDLPPGIDMAVVAVPAAGVVETVAACAERGIGGITLLTAGFSESGEDGAQLQEDLEEIIASTGIRIIGPNCIGFMNLHGGVMANFAITADEPLPDVGPVAMVSQSGGFGSYIATRAIAIGLKLGWFVSTGNEVDVNLAAVLNNLVRRDEVKVLLTFSEALRDPEVFIEAAREAARRDKPIVLLKAGRSEEASRAALSHTASIVGSADVLDAVCKQYGVHVVSTMEEMLDLGTVFQNGRRTTGSGLGIVVTSGGAGVLFADCAAAEGLTVPAIPEAASEALAALMPPPFYGSVANPIDTTAQIMASPSNYNLLLDAVLDLDEIDMFTTVTWAAKDPESSSGRVNSALVRAYESTKKPFGVVSTGYLDQFRAVDLPTFLDPRRATRAFAAVVEQSAHRVVDDSADDIVAPHSEVSALIAAARNSMVLEPDAKAIIKSFGVRVTREGVATTAEEATRIATDLGTKVALKALAHELPHKSDYGAIRLGLHAQDVAEAYDDMLAEVSGTAPHAKVEGVLVQEMVPARLEMTCGLHRDPVFGPMVSIGLGGVTVEILASTALVRAPFNKETALATIRNYLDGRLVTAKRGLDESELDALGDLMVSVSRVALAHPEISEIDINPLRIADGAVVAADALIVLNIVNPTT